MIAWLQEAVTGDNKQAEQKLGQSSICSGQYLCPCLSFKLVDWLLQSWELVMRWRFMCNIAPVMFMWLSKPNNNNNNNAFQLMMS